MFFKLITDVRSHIGLVWHFAMRFFLDLDFSLSSICFFAVGSFFCLRFFVFFIFLFFESRDDDEVAYLVYVVRNDEVG